MLPHNPATRAFHIRLALRRSRGLLSGSFDTLYRPVSKYDQCFVRWLAELVKHRLISRKTPEKGGPQAPGYRIRRSPISLQMISALETDPKLRQSP